LLRVFIDTVQVLMRALGFDVKKPEVVKMVHDVDPANSGAVDYLQFLEISKLKRSGNISVWVEWV
jgi:centrin-3